MLQIIWKWYTRWQAERARLRDLECCSPFDLDRIAQDLGMSVSELRQVTASGDAGLLFARLRDNQIDTTTVDPAVLRDLQRCCSSCKKQTLCEHEVEDRPVEAKWPAYCPNQSTIAALTQMRCH
jgi:hypothetical protein